MLALLSTDFPLLIKTLYIVYLPLREMREGDKRKKKAGFKKEIEKEIERKRKGAGKNLH